jgi:hypothetical protein
MNTDQHLSPHRQQKLEFALDRTWRQLPPSCHCECKSILTQMLVEIIQSESEEGNDHERQDLS